MFAQGHDYLIVWRYKNRIIDNISSVKAQRFFEPNVLAKCHLLFSAGRHRPLTDKSSSCWATASDSETVPGELSQPIAAAHHDSEHPRCVRKNIGSNKNS